MRLPLSLSFGAALIGTSFLLAAPVTASAAPLVNAFSKDLLSYSGDNSPVIQVQGRRGGGRVGRGGGGGGGGRGGGGGWGGGGGGGGAAAAGIIGLAVGAIIASEAARQQQGVQQGVEYCISRYRSYNPETGIWIDRRGRQHQCP